MNVSVFGPICLPHDHFCVWQMHKEREVLWNKRHTHTHTYITAPMYHGESVRQGIHSPSCRSVATDKGDVLRPLLIQHSGKGLQILHLLSPHNSSGLGAPHTYTWIKYTQKHTAGCTYTQTKQPQTTKYADKPTQIQTYKLIRIISPLNHKQTHGRTDTLCMIPRLAKLKQMKELVNEIWLNSLKCSTAALWASVEQNDNISQSCHNNNLQEHPSKGLFKDLDFFLSTVWRLARMCERRIFF